MDGRIILLRLKMASFHTKTFTVHDDYMTPKHAWEDIAEYIPKDKIIWEAFYGDGASGNHLLDLGCQEVIHRDVDFYENDLGEVILSNPPFTQGFRRDDGCRVH